MTDERVSDEPRLAPKDYLDQYSEPFEGDDGGFEIDYYGLGVRPSEHPLNDRMPLTGSQCGNCKSQDVLIIAAKWSVHPMSGDCYWDFECYCESCGKYTIRSYAEN